MNVSPESLQGQISNCLKAIDGLRHCIRGRDWARLAKVNSKLDREMELLRLSVEGRALDEPLLSQLSQLNLQFRRSQRQLSSQISAVESDVESLEKGMRKVAMIRGALEKS